MDPIKKPDPDERADWSAIFGETPGASAYDRQLGEVRAAAAKASRMATEAAESARHAEAVCRRAKSLAESMVERQERFVRIARNVQIYTVVLLATTIAAMVFAAIRLAW